MRFTHLDIVTVLGGVLALVIFMLGYWRGHYRAYAECCDCCTCQTCTDEEPIEGVVVPSEPRPVDMSSFWDDTVSNLELHSIAEPVAYEAQITADAVDSTFISRVLLSWESRYPILQEVR